MPGTGKVNGNVRTREFTGFHMLLTICGFFLVVITANLSLAYFAAGSWTGLVVKNSYVASQNFNEHLATAQQQEDRGWASALSYDAGTLSFELHDSAGETIAIDTVTATLQRPVHENEDHNVDLRPTVAGAFEVFVQIPDGMWVVEIEAQSSQDETYKQVFRLNIGPEDRQ